MVKLKIIQESSGADGQSWEAVTHRVTISTRMAVASTVGTAPAIWAMKSYYTGGISNPSLTTSKIIAAVFTPVKLVKVSV